MPEVGGGAGDGARGLVERHTLGQGRVDTVGGLLDGVLGRHGDLVLARDVVAGGGVHGQVHVAAAEERSELVDRAVLHRAVESFPSPPTIAPTLQYEAEVRGGLVGRLVAVVAVQARHVARLVARRGQSPLEARHVLCAAVHHTPRLHHVLTAAVDRILAQQRAPTHHASRTALRSGLHRELHRRRLEHRLGLLVSIHHRLGLVALRHLQTAELHEGDGQWRALYPSESPGAVTLLVVGGVHAEDGEGELDGVLLVIGIVGRDHQHVVRGVQHRGGNEKARRHTLSSDSLLPLVGRSRRRRHGPHIHRIFVLSNRQ